MSSYRAPAKRAARRGETRVALDETLQQIARGQNITGGVADALRRAAERRTERLMHGKEVA